MVIGTNICTWELPPGFVQVWRGGCCSIGCHDVILLFVKTQNWAVNKCWWWQRWRIWHWWKWWWFYDLVSQVWSWRLITLQQHSCIITWHTQVAEYLCHAPHHLLWELVWIDWLRRPSKPKIFISCRLWLWSWWSIFFGASLENQAEDPKRKKRKKKKEKAPI